MKLRTLCVVVALGVLASPASAQRLLGVSTGLPFMVDFTLLPGAPCGQPTPFAGATPFVMPPVCLGPVPGPIPFGALLGDIADNPLTDTVFVTDGFAIGEYTGDTPCFAPPPGMLINHFPVPPMPGGALTGMGMDPTGAITGGLPTLWVTDGFFLAGVMPSPPGTCGPPIFLFPPCLMPTPFLAPFTDVSWDPATLTIWACDAAGFIHNIAPGPPCVPTMPPFPAAGCAFGGPLTGIAYDTSTPGVLGVPPRIFVTDGLLVGSLMIGGAPSPPAFYAPLPCSPSPMPLAGLTLTHRSVSYGAPRVIATLDTFGQATTPGPTFGIEITGSPPGATAFLIAAINIPGPGFLCPPGGAVGTTLWVAPPLLVLLPLGPMPPGCVAIPLPIPPAAPVGVQIFMQVFLMAGGPPAADSTNGIEVTLGPP